MPPAGKDAPTEAEIPARVAAFIDQIAKHQRGRFTGRWATAQDARVYPEAVIPALIVALQHDQTRTKARQLLVEVGPAAAPHVQKEVDRMKTELATDPTLERTIQIMMISNIKHYTEVERKTIIINFFGKKRNSWKDPVLVGWLS